MMEPNALKNDHVNFVLRLYWFTLVILVILSLTIKKGAEVIWINSNHSIFSDNFFATITSLGEGWLFIPILIVLLFVRFKYAIMAISVAALHSLACLVLKRFLFSGELRPKNLLDCNLLHFVPGVDVHGYHSFPSGHTATMICIAVFLSLLLRHQVWSLILLGLALTVAYSRIYLLQHFLIDVTAGAVVGAGSAFFIWHIFEGFTLPPWLESSLPIKWPKSRRMRRINLG